MTWYNGKSFKGRGVYFSATFSLASPLSDRKVPSNTYGHLYNTISLYFGFFNWSHTFRPMKGNPKVLDSGLLWVPDSSVSRTWIPDSNCQWYLRFLSCILNSKAQDFRFHKQKFLDCGIQIPLHGANTHFRSINQTDASTTSFPKRGRRLGNLVLSLNFSYIISSVHYA